MHGKYSEQRMFALYVELNVCFSSARCTLQCADNLRYAGLGLTVGV